MPKKSRRSYIGEQERIDLEVAAPKFADDLSARHVPVEDILVAAARREADVVARNAHIKNLVAVPEVGLHAEPFDGVPQLDDPVLLSRKVHLNLDFCDFFRTWPLSIKIEYFEN